MPISIKAADYLTRDHLHRARGIESLEFNGLLGTCVTAPDYYDLLDEFEGVFKKLVEGIDWRRVWIEATGHAMAMEAAGLRKPSPLGGPIELCVGPDDMACTLGAGEFVYDWTQHVATVHANDKKVSAR